MISLSSGTWDDSAGRRRDQRSLTVVVQVDGKPTSADCRENAWWVDEIPEIVRVEVGALDFMCRDDVAAYVAGESWTKPDGSICKCSSDFQVSCQDGL